MVKKKRGWSQFCETLVLSVSIAALTGCIKHEVKLVTPPCAEELDDLMMKKMMIHMKLPCRLDANGNCLNEPPGCECKAKR